MNTLGTTFCNEIHINQVNTQTEMHKHTPYLHIPKLHISLKTYVQNLGVPVTKQVKLKITENIYNL